MLFEWDENKRIANLKKHEVDFFDAAAIFDRPTIEQEDKRRAYREKRWRALGRVDDVALLVAYVQRGDVRRIISAWKVNEDGEKRYTKLLGG